MKSLFENDFYTSAAKDVESVTTAKLRETFQYFVNEGYSIRDIAHLMFKAVVDLELEFMMEKKEIVDSAVFAIESTIAKENENELRRDHRAYRESK